MGSLNNILTVVAIAVLYSCSVASAQGPMGPPGDVNGNTAEYWIAKCAVESLTFTSDSQGNGVHSLDAVAEYSAGVAPTSISGYEESWQFASALGVYNVSSQEWYFRTGQAPFTGPAEQYGYSYTTLQPGQTATWSIDSAGTSTIHADEYKAFAQIMMRRLDYVSGNPIGGWVLDMNTGHKEKELFVFDE